MTTWLRRITLVLACWSAVASPGSCSWELRRDDLRPARPVVEKGVVQIDPAGRGVRFPRYLNELGVRVIRILFRDEGPGSRILSVVWTGGSMGPDRFEVVLDGVSMGRSLLVNSEKRPYAWYRDVFRINLLAGQKHVLEIRALPEYTSAVEFAGFRWSVKQSSLYQPFCYESAGSLERYESLLGGKGVAVESSHLVVFAPVRLSAEAKRLADFLEEAYQGLQALYGIEPFFRFSVEHYPEGHARGWGGISGAGTIGYKVEALERFTRLWRTDVRGFAGYTEEMSHGFKACYKASGTYEALGVAVQEDLVRRLVSEKVADAFWLPEHRQWETTHAAYLAAGKRNPDPARYPNTVLYTRILNHVFHELRKEYGPSLWPDLFAAVRRADYPLHRAAKTEFLAVYARILSGLFHRDIGAEWERAGITLTSDPPWGWQTYG